MHDHAMHREHERLHRSLAVLRPPRRFQLLVLLLSGVDRSVSQLARAVRLSQSCTTRHLQALELAGFVKGTRDGKRVVFRPAPRDAVARGVLASLARSEEDMVFQAGLALGAIPVASSVELEPLTDEVEILPPHDPRTEIAEPPVVHEAPESGNRFESPAPPRRFATDIEDFLL